MNCDTSPDRITLYLYGELDSEDEERFEQHLEGCALCRGEIERARSVSRALGARALDPDPRLLTECRVELIRAVERSAAPGARGWLQRFSLSPAPHPAVGLRRLAFAAAMVALGFLAATVTLRGPLGTKLRMGQEPLQVSEAGLFPPAETFSTVRSVQPDPVSGRVRIGLEETRRHFISGSLDDEQVQRLLLAAAADQANSGLRAESIGILKDRSRSTLVRQMLLEALSGDPNPGVRLNALDGLKSCAGDVQVRRALATALLTDQNPGVRVEVIEVLTQHPDDSLVGVFQNLVHRENNNYVRLRAREALRQMNASEGTF